MQNLSSRMVIEEITQEALKSEEDFLESYREQDSYSSVFTLSPEIKTLKNKKQTFDLQQKIKSMSLCTNSRENILKTQLADLENQICSVSSRKQAVKEKYNDSKEACTAEIFRLKETLAALEQEYAILTKSIKNKTKIQIESKQARIKGYQETVKELETKLDFVIDQKNKLIPKTNDLGKKIDQFKNMISMAKEELLSRYSIRGELIAENEQAEEYFEVFKENLLENFNSQELKDYFEGCTRIKTEQEMIIGKIKDTQLKAERIKEEKNDLEKAFQENEKKIESFFLFVNQNEEKEIEGLESLIKETCENLNLEYLENVILSVNSFEGFDLDEEILKIQLQKVESEEALFKENWIHELEILQDSIKSTQEAEAKKILEKELKLKTQQFFNKSSAITQWKTEVLAVINKNKQIIGPVKDRAIFLEFRNISISQIEHLQSQKSFEKIISLYIEKLSTKEKIIQENFKKILKLQTIKENTKKKLRNLSQELLKLEQYKLSDQLQLSKLVCKEKSLILFIKNTDQDLISKVEDLVKSINYWSVKIKNQSEIIETLKILNKNASDELKNMLKEAQNYKIIIKDASEEENSITLQIEKILEKQHSFMIETLNETPANPHFSNLTTEIDKVAEELEKANKKVQTIENDYSVTIAKLEQEESIFHLQLQGIQNGLKTLNQGQKKIEEFEYRLSKIGENDAAPIPDCMIDRIRAKSMNKIKIPALETPEKPPSDYESLSSFQNCIYQKTVSSRPGFTKVGKPEQDELNISEKQILEKNFRRATLFADSGIAVLLIRN